MVEVGRGSRVKEGRGGTCEERGSYSRHSSSLQRESMEGTVAVTQSEAIEDRFTVQDAELIEQSDQKTHADMA